MIFCSSSLMPLDENAHCTNALMSGRQVFFSLLSRCSGVVSSFCWSCLFVLLVCWARLGWVPGVERIWIDLCQRREGGTIYMLSQRSGLPHFVRAIVKISTRRWMKSWSWSWSREMGNLHPAVWDQVKKYGLARDEKYKRGILMKIFC